MQSDKNLVKEVWLNINETVHQCSIRSEVGLVDCMVHARLGKMKIKKKLLLLSVPGMLGIAVFYLIPGMAAVYYAMIDNLFLRRFVGLKNIAEVLTNENFWLSVWNLARICVLSTLGVTGVCVVLLFLVYLRGRVPYGIILCLLLPFFMPTASWVDIFQNRLQPVLETCSSWIPFLPKPSVMLVPALFLWRYTGVCLAILTAGYATLDRGMLDAAAVEGAGRGYCFRRLLLPALRQYLLLAVLFCLSQGMQIFREIYFLFETDYPPKEVYTLHFFLNNHFFRLNYQTLASASILVIVLLLPFFLLGGKLAGRNEP